MELGTPWSYSWPQRFKDVFGARLGGRWRPAPLQIEVFATGAWEHQTVIYTPPTSGSLIYDTATFTAGATWLSRQPRVSQPLTADLSGLYHPLVEPKQVRLDAFSYLRTESGALNADTRLYRVQATTGVRSWMQASGYVGAVFTKDSTSYGGFEHSASFGGDVRLRVMQVFELYAALERQRVWFVDQYPMFVLASGSSVGQPFDFLQPSLEGTYSAHVGARLVF